MTTLGQRYVRLRGLGVVTVLSVELAFLEPTADRRPPSCGWCERRTAMLGLVAELVPADAETADPDLVVGEVEVEICRRCVDRAAPSLVDLLAGESGQAAEVRVALAPLLRKLGAGGDLADTAVVTVTGAPRAVRV